MWNMDGVTFTRRPWQPCKRWSTLLIAKGSSSVAGMPTSAVRRLALASRQDPVPGGCGTA